MTRALVLLVIGITGLLSLRVAYDLTREPAPGIRVRWRDGTSDGRRAWLEWKYRLVEPAAPQGLSYAYVLMDTRTANIGALVKDPEVADTGDIDREKFEIPWETANESRTFMWTADRLPVLRQPVARWMLIASLVLMAATGTRAIIGAISWREVGRATREWLHRMPDGTDND
ncbi:MAG TPA: hypothetical protein VGJ78_06925 [Vicinamibacterales bacterium]